jgi:nucleotide-binding universal stress UspA family protein/dienelactone hydrolase
VPGTPLARNWLADDFVTREESVVMFTVRTILQPTDLSEASVAAFRVAKSLAKSYGAKLVVTTAYPPPVNAAEAVDRGRPGGDPAPDLLARLKAERPADGAVTYRVGEGDPADVILDSALREGCDLIVMGTHGRTGVRRAIMGSVAEAVSRKAPCPVVTVRPGVTEGKVVSDDRMEDVAIPVGPHTLHATLRRPAAPRGVVVFAHGSGSSRHSPRNGAVATALTESGYATLLLDLLDEAEAEDRKNVFDAELLAGRLIGAINWVTARPDLAGLPVGLFGASTGSGAALTAAARHPDRIAAVVSRSGRPDLAWDDLPAVAAPTLLLVGGDDTAVLGHNRDALDRMPGTKKLVTVPGATHLFPEPGAMGEVIRSALAWFENYLGFRPAGKPG